MTSIEEGDAPTAPEPLLIDDDKSTLAKMTAMWIKIDGLFERIKAKLEPQESQSKSASEDVSKASIHASHGGAIAQANVTGEKVKGWLTSTLLGLSIFINVWLILEYRAAGTEQRLQQYNLDWFKTHEFSDLRSDVRLQEKLIETQCRR